MNPEELLENLCQSLWDKMQDEEVYQNEIKQIQWTKKPDNPAKGIVVVEYTTGDFEFFIVAIHRGSIIATLKD